MGCRESEKDTTQATKESKLPKDLGETDSKLKISYMIQEKGEERAISETGKNPKYFSSYAKYK